MRSSVYTRRTLSIVATMLLLGALAVIAPAAMAQDNMALNSDFQGTLTLTITNNGIVPSSTSPVGGLYTVTVRNDTSGPRGIMMTGIDRCCAPYVRYTAVLAPGQQQTFRWFFPSDRTVQMRDLLRCVRSQRSCSTITVGDLSTQLSFQ